MPPDPEEDVMDHTTFDTLTRRASTLSLVAGFASPLAAGAKTKAKKKLKKKQRQKCQAQVGRCELFLAAACDGDPECLATRPPCCTLLAACDFPAFLTCLV
jgi:hypothetical protein